MAKIVIIGAGSGFGGRLSLDILSRKALQDSTICLCDIHPGRLEKVYQYIRRTIEHHGLRAKVVAGTDRRELLVDADFVVTSVSVGGGAYYGYPYNVEMEIPRKYGIDQWVGDTITPGGIFRFLRTAPVHLQIFRDVEELAPNALLLNHTNPMSMLTWVQHAMTNVRNVGLCHGIQYTVFLLSKYTGIPQNEIVFKVAGINHLAWFLELKHLDGRDLYPEIWKLWDNPEVVAKERVRLELMKAFGYFCTESNGHDSEYLPYFRKSPELIAELGLKIKEVQMTAPTNREWLRDSGIEGEEAPVGELKLSNEYSSGIIEAVVTDVPYRFSGNVMNTGLITNLPEGCCVEVPCMVDRLGVHPCHIGDLPPQLAALDRSHIGSHELAVNAVIHRDREMAFQALALDPITADALNLSQIRSMFEEMWEAEKHLLAYFDSTHKGPMPETCAD